MYKYILKPIFFKFDSEKVHDFFIYFGNILGNFSITKSIINFIYNYNGKDISKIVDGIEYRTPFILSAGFDYNANLMNILPEIGFSGEEIGSVTARPCNGNAKPRLTRLINSESILVNKGLKNDGVEVIISRIKKYKENKNLDREFVLGISIARTNDDKSISIEAGIEDYTYSFKRLNEENIGDFYTINISCPNSFGGEAFSDPILLERLLINLKKVSCSKPIYIKMPINLVWDKFSKLLSIIDKYNINGVIIGNLNKDYSYIDRRDNIPEEYRGGLSGRPCINISNNLIKKTKEIYGNRFTIIGCGGVMSIETAKEKFDSGADLIQLVTGIIYKGPGLIKKLCYNYSIK